MFDSFKAMGAVGALMKNKDKLEDAGRRIQAELESLRVEGRAGGGAVVAVVTGKMRVESVTLDPAFVIADDQSRAMAQELIVEAINDASDRARERVGAIIEREAEALGVPELVGPMREQLGGLLG